MNPDHLRLWDLVNKAGQGSRLSQEELAFAETCLRTQGSQNRANACEVLLRCSRLATPAQSRNALETLERLCLKASQQYYVLTLLTAMLYTSFDAFSDPAAMQDFVLRCGGSKRFEIRAMSVSLLHRMAREDNRPALDLIKRMANDTNESVRTNARISLREFED